MTTVPAVTPITPAERRPPTPRGPGGRSLARSGSRWFGADAVLGTLVRAAAVTILLMLAALLVVLTMAAMPTIREYGFSFLTSSEWRPNELERPVTGPDGKVVIEDGEVLTETLPPRFGALPVIYGTFVSSALALIFAIPLSLGAALFLVRVAKPWLAKPTSFLIEFLAAIPSIAYGLWGLFVLAPFLQRHVEPFLRDTVGKVPGLGWMFYDGERAIALNGRDMFCGGLVLGIMVLPIITAISRDVLQAVPRIQIEGTLALGATWWQSCKEMLRYSRSGLFGAIMLGLARAAGETMAVTMVIGNNNQIEPSPFQPAQTMSSLLANEFAEAASPIHRSALIEVALILLVMSLAFNVIARWLVVGGGARTSAAH
ncbi:MAG TPA: phosphate ABC transporter permease subunit PstC [Tepidisphaeraceae bacterium]|nr:phosphate ABC transporter permease subunit PstC [Tepidisphaeraceae bacterium]